MQPCTPAREVTGLVNGYGAFTVPVRHRHHSEEIDGQLSLPAPDRLVINGQPHALDGRPIIEPAPDPGASDGDPDQVADEVRDGGGSGPDEDLPRS